VRPTRKQAAIGGGGIIIVAIVLVVVLSLRGGKVTAGDTPIAKQISIEFPSPGTTLVMVNGQPDKAQLLVAGSDLWASTGLKIAPGRVVKITASGRANLSVHRLIDASNYDTRPRHGWIGPDGGTTGDKQVKDTYRQQLKIKPTSPDGVLLAFLHQKGSSEPGKDNPRPGGPSEIVVIGSNGEVKNHSGVEKTLWLVLNDAVLANDPQSRLSYMAVERDDDPRVDVRPTGFSEYIADDPRSWTSREHWNYVLKEQYWNVWFDDNMGFYQVQVVFEPAG
jgi:hypothetical protein